MSAVDSYTAMGVDDDILDEHNSQKLQKKQGNHREKEARNTAQSNGKGVVGVE